VVLNGWNHSGQHDSIGRPTPGTWEPTVVALGRNLLFYGDNLDVLRNRIPTASVDLIYLDPPFNSNRSYNVLFRHRSGAEAQAQIEAFDDTWIWSQESEKVFRELVEGGAPAKVADALEAMRKLLGDNDLLAYLVLRQELGRVSLCRKRIASRASRRARFFARGAVVAVRARQAANPCRTWPMGRPAGR
jgi:hypothetical protein